MYGDIKLVAMAEHAISESTCQKERISKIMSEIMSPAWKYSILYSYATFNSLLILYINVVYIALASRKFRPGRKFKPYKY